jgi:hypothetical protein
MFALRIDPEQIWYGREIGPMVVIGFSQARQERIEVRGLGVIPAPGGRLVISDTPAQQEEIHGEQVPFFPYETILHVEEVPVPPELVARLRTRSTES